MALTGPRSPMRSLRLLLFLPLLLPALLSRTLVSATVSGAGAAAADDDHDDPCPAISDGGGGGCHVSCFRPDPVCGENGVTYWCGCHEAACAGSARGEEGVLRRRQWRRRPRLGSSDCGICHGTKDELKDERSREKSLRR
ncbi:hypothetical protein ACMD2_07021 [Ananas comosus]|uniref:Kazal-like domain-containing protein n=1 Tax=Ananas comosus TaxID=4615 RepID=A0A199VCU5_ANACO|nr:hypothetical protein ACMD2_07021 [Ananas comosus]